MNTTILPSYIEPLFKTSWFPDVPLQQKKVLAIATFAFGLLATLYLIRDSSQKVKTSKEHSLISDSVARLKTLDVVPENHLFETDGGTFVSPHVSMLEINHFLEAYIVKWGYVGASFSMRANQIYGKTISNQPFTAVYFKKQNSSLYHSAQNFFNFSSQPSNLDMRKKELKECISKIIDKWGYESIQVGDVNREFFSKEQAQSDYELYLLLFYKKHEGG